MSEFIGGEEKIINVNDQIVFENKTDSNLEVGVGIIFHNSGLYDISISENRVIVTKVAVSPPAQPEQKWIPCEEALPNKNGFYEVTVSSPYKPVRIYEYKPCDLYENENRWKSEDGCYALNWFIKAWRECPKPYERG